MTSRQGFALTELLVSTFLLGVATVAITGLAVLGSRTAFESERQTIALAIMNEKVEVIRSLAYDDVGYTDATEDEPDGIILRREEIVRNQQDYTVDILISNVDDPINGELAAGTLNESTADYKNVKVEVSWNSVSGTNRRLASVVTHITKSDIALRCTPGDPVGCPGSDTSGTDFPGTGACVPNEPCPGSGICPMDDEISAYCPPGALYCPQCYSDGDCSAGQACNVGTGQCTGVVGGCQSNDECSAGQACVYGSCTAACTSNTDCDSGEICNVDTGVCTLPCTGNACSCLTGTSCNTETGLCASTSPTPTPTPTPTPSTSGTPDPSATPTPSPSASPTPSTSSSPNPSPTPQCDDDSDCGEGQSCVDHGGISLCDDQCNNNSDCPSGQECTDGGTCGGCEQAPPPPPPDCSLLPPVPPPGLRCASTAECILGGAYGIDSWTPRQDCQIVQNCGIYCFQNCEPEGEWYDCGDECATPEPSPAACSDGIDNDTDDYSTISCGRVGDGKIDCEDPGCHLNWDLSQPCRPEDTSEKDDYECNDGEDNDGDGYTDYPFDRGCGGYNDADEDLIECNPSDCPPGEICDYCMSQPLGSFAAFCAGGGEVCGQQTSGGCVNSCENNFNDDGDFSTAEEPGEDGDGGQGTPLIDEDEGEDFFSNLRPPFGSGAEDSDGFNAGNRWCPDTLHLCLPGFECVRGEYPGTDAKCPSAFLKNEEGKVEYQQHILKGNISESVKRTTYERLRSATANQQMNVVIAEGLGDKTYLDALSILQINHSNETQAYVDQDGHAWLASDTTKAAEVSVSSRGDKDEYAFFTDNAEGVTLTGGLTEAVTGDQRRYLRDELRLQCVPGIYDIVDSASPLAIADIVAKLGGIIVHVEINGQWQELSKYPIMLENDETAFVKLPAGTSRVKLTTPAGSYNFSKVELIENIRPADDVIELKSDNPALQAIDENESVVTEEAPLEVAFQPKSADSSATFYFQSTGYYHYLEGRTEQDCTVPSLRYDVVADYLFGS